MQNKQFYFNGYNFLQKKGVIRSAVYHVFLFVKKKKKIIIITIPDKVKYDYKIFEFMSLIIRLAT